MNQLVVGGLLLVGVLALVAIVFVLRSEPVTKTIAADTPTSIPLATGQSEIQSAVSEPSLATQTTPVPELVLPIEDQQSEEWSTTTDGQFHELVSELSALHQQVQEFEQRISVLRVMLERIEYTQQQEHSSFNEDAQHLSNVHSVN